MAMVITTLEYQRNQRIRCCCYSNFDRYGKLIKQIDPNGLGWDGTFNKELLPSTDYWFTIEYTKNNITKEFKGHFSLIR